MLIEHFKSEPIEYVRKTVNGQALSQGQGISFFYLPFRSSIELVSLAAKDQPFAFPELCADSQEVQLQGEMIYRITSPELVMARYNFSVDPKTKSYLTDDPESLSQHLLALVRASARKIVKQTPLEKLIVMPDDLSVAVQESLFASGAVKALGVTYEAVHFSSITPKPEIAKALEASYRESLLQRSDEAIYSRRAKAVEQERTIKQNEMETAIDLEKKREELIELQGRHTGQEAIYKADAEKKMLDAYQDTDADRLAALGFLSIGRNVQKIETFTMTPELLAGLLQRRKA